MEEIVVPIEVRLKKKESAERVILDVFQKSDLLNQLIQTLSPEDQKNALKLQEMRRRMEILMYLQKKVVKYGLTGEPRGLLQTSVTTLAEYIKFVHIPMTRKVVSLTKVLYTQGDPSDLEENIRTENLSEIIKRAATLQKEMDIDGGVKVGLPSFYLNMEKYRSIVQSPYILHPAEKSVTVDEEAFRNDMPNFEKGEASVYARDVYDSSKKPPISQIPYSTVRLVKPRIVQLQDATRIIEGGDSPSFTNTLLFPRSVGRDMGPIRSGKLARDISYGMKTPIPMEKLLKKLGTPTEFPTSGNILSIGLEGSIQGTVLLETWLDLQNYLLFGPGDIYEELVGYSLDSLEFTKEQQEILSFKIQQGIAALRLYITKKREENRAALANLRFTRNDLLPVDRNGRLHTRILNEPSLQEMCKALEQQVGKELSEIDSMWFSYVYVKYPDFLLATLGETASVVTKFRHIHVRNSILKAIQSAYLDSVIVQNRGEQPVENKCSHVKMLYAIEKTENDVDKMKKYISLLGEYRGDTEDSWINCRKCKQHLLCMHELILLQEYMRPKEKDVLHKELLLNYSGGQFSGKYMCKNCGKSIGELELDTNLEFDDQGHPLMGREVMEEEEDDAVEDIMEGLKEEEDEELGMNEVEKGYLRVFKAVTERLGINPEPTDFKAMVEQVGQYLLTLLPKEEYAELLRQKKVRQDYEIYYNIRYVAAITAILVLNIQCRVPDYTIYYSRAECKEGFMGFPISGNDQMTGVQCITSIVASIQNKEAPWNLTSLQKLSDLVKRREVLQPIVVKLLEEFIETKPLHQVALVKKREYMKKVFGTVSGIKKDTIASSFRPELYVVLQDAAKAPIISEGATAQFKATAWIRQAHEIVKENTNLRDGSVLSQTTSCLHPITRPNEFWEGKSMPSLPSKTFEERMLRTKTITTKNIYKEKAAIVGKVEEKNFYKLFMDVCYEGSRKGLPHELGLGLTCLRCGMRFEENPNLPPTLDPSPEVQRVEMEKDRIKKKAFLEQQGVDVGTEAFSDLLHTMHVLAKMETPKAKRIHGISDVVREIISVENPPFDAWATLLLSANTALEELGDNLTEIQIVKAAEPFITRILEIEEDIEKRLNSSIKEALVSMTSGTVTQTTEFVRTYLIIPFQRWINGINVESYDILDSYKLDQPAKDAILKKGMGNHLEPLLEEIPSGKLLAKLNDFVSDMSVACRSVFPSIRPLFIRGGSVMSKFILRGFIMGYVYNYINPNVEPRMPVEGAFSIETTYKSIGKAIFRYSSGSRIPNEQEIRMRLEERVEKEKQLFIGSLAGMTAEKKKVDLLNKQLGIGKWAVQDKDIRKYNSERFLVEQRERMEGGFNVAEGDAGAGMDSGYDNTQQAEDDY